MHIALDVMADFQQLRISQQRLQKSGNGRGGQTFRPFAFGRGKKIEGFRLFRFGGKRQINRTAAADGKRHADRPVKNRIGSVGQHLEGKSALFFNQPPPFRKRFAVRGQPVIFRFFFCRRRFGINLFALFLNPAGQPRF